MQYYQHCFPPIGEGKSTSKPQALLGFGPQLCRREAADDYPLHSTGEAFRGLTQKTAGSAAENEKAGRSKPWINMPHSGAKPKLSSFCFF